MSDQVSKAFWNIPGTILQGVTAPNAGGVSVQKSQIHSNAFVKFFMDMVAVWDSMHTLYVES